MALSSSEKSSSTHAAPQRESPWTLVRSGSGVDSDHLNLQLSDQVAAAAAPMVGFDCVNCGNVKKSAWSTPSNGVADVIPVMGADSWPALSESTSKTVPKSFALDSINVDSNHLASVVSNHLIKASSNPNSPRQKIMKHSNTSGGSGSNIGLQVNGGPVSSPFHPSLDIPPQIPLEKPREMPNNKNNTNWDHGPRTSKSSGSSPHTHGGSDHHRPFHRKGKIGGGGSGLHSGGRRDPYRGVYSGDWNNPPPHLRPPPFVRPPPPSLPAGAAPYIGLPPPLRPFVAPPMGFHEIHSPFYYMSSPPPFVGTYPMTHAMPPTMLVSMVDYHRNLVLDQMVLNQIEYYFSDANLWKDKYLRMQMDEQGWVSVSLIAGFNRVKQYTNNMPNATNYIVDVLRASELLEVQGERIRRRGDWKKWLYDPTLPNQGGSSSGPQFPANAESMVNRMQDLVLEDKTGSN